MSSTIPLPGGASATLRDPEQVSERHRRPVTRLNLQLAGSPIGDLLEAKQKGTLTGDAFDAESRKLMGSASFELLDEIADAVIVALVESWSFDLPITLDGLLDLPGAAYDELKAITGKSITALLPNFTPNADPDSPTPPSAG